MSMAFLIAGALLGCQREPRGMIVGAYRCCDFAEQNQCQVVESVCFRHCR